MTLRACGSFSYRHFRKARVTVMMQQITKILLSLAGSLLGLDLDVPRLELPTRANFSTPMRRSQIVIMS